jgi:hypothetical protein
VFTARYALESLYKTDTFRLQRFKQTGKLTHIFCPYKLMSVHVTGELATNMQKCANSFAKPVRLHGVKNRST